MIIIIIKRSQVGCHKASRDATAVVMLISSFGDELFMTISGWSGWLSKRSCRLWRSCHFDLMFRCHAVLSPVGPGTLVTLIGITPQCIDGINNNALGFLYLEVSKYSAGFLIFWEGPKQRNAPEIDSHSHTHTHTHTHRHSDSMRS